MKDKLTQETKEKIDLHNGESAPSTRPVHKWFPILNSDHQSCDVERSGQLVEATRSVGIMMLLMNGRINECFYCYICQKNEIV